ncbi:MAG: flavin-binding protein [Erythrobacter sp.]
MIETLDDVRADAEARMIEAGRSRHTPMHTPVVGTGNGDMRVMVLREYDPATRLLRFHTDTRSPKVTAIGVGEQAGTPMGVLLYDPAAKIQIRCTGMGRVEVDGAVADAAWAESTNFARRCYLAEDAPGAKSAEAVSGLPEWAVGLNPSEEQVAPARENFAVLLVEAQQLDWLFLSNEGHRRAILTASASGGWDGNWVVP